MKELQITARLEIHAGKLNAFKEVAKKCLDSVREKDKGTLQYDWFLSEDGTICMVRDRADGAAASAPNETTGRQGWLPSAASSQRRRSSQPLRRLYVEPNDWRHV